MAAQARGSGDRKARREGARGPARTLPPAPSAAAGPLALALLAGALLPWAGPAEAAAGAPPRGAWEASLGFSYLEGDYGTGRSSEIRYAPFYLRYRRGRSQLKLTVPYLSVRTQGVILAGGTVIGTRDTGRASTRAGLGDVWLEARHRLARPRGPALTPYLRIKFGTASRAKGLGTGENDYELGLAAQHRWGARAFPFLQAGYRFVGRAPGYRLRDIALLRGGLSWLAGSRHVLTGLLAGRQASQPRLEDALDLIVAWTYDRRPGRGWQLYVDKGLTHGSPDYGVGLSARWRF